MIPLGEIEPARFLREYWQKKPLLIRHAFPRFEPELQAEDVAGLACEDWADARLVTGRFPEHDWQVRYGPFDENDFAQLPPKHWTLLVQDVEKHYPPLAAWLDAFSFLPRWRIDDLMISVSGPGGSVGPHMDQYDVFLLQASGSKRWQLAETFDPRQQANCEISVLQKFEAEQEWELEAGDLLYLPPGVAHYGLALDNGMTWSIGMRAPSAADLFLAFGEWLAANADEGDRYRDPGLEPLSSPGEVDRAAVARFRGLCRRYTETADPFERFLGDFLSSYRLVHQAAPPEDTCDSKRLQQALAAGSRLSHHPWTRILWLSTENGALLFAGGDAFPCSRAAARLLSDPARLRRTSDLPASPALELCLELLNRGHLYLSQN
jgi:50S ribosomal protein L16 3-hydroxylase